MPFRGVDPNRMSFLQHLEELRARLIRCVLALAIAFFAAWPLSDQLYEILVLPVKAALPPGVRLAYTGISDPFMLYTKISAFAAIFVALPYALLEFWLFISPGLYKKEKRWALPFTGAATLFFAAGAYFAYQVIVPYACLYFIGVGLEAGFEPVITIKEVFSFVLQMILATGAIFELPVIVFFLTRVGFLTPAFLWHYFGYAFFVIWVIAAFITPPDIFSMMLVGIPMTLLYLFSVFVSWVFLPRRREPPPAAG